MALEVVRPETRVDIVVVEVLELRFAAGDPVRAASGVVGFGDGWLVAQDDAVHAAWWRPGLGTVEPVRVLPARGGHETFEEAAGTKRLKPDLEAACPVPTGGGETVLMLGSGSLPPRTVGVLLGPGPEGRPVSRHADLGPLYERVRDALELEEGDLNLEGACVIGQRLRWFQRGHGRTDVPSASVDLDLDGLLAVLDGDVHPGDVGITEVHRYELGDAGALPLAITDAVALPDGRICVSATAEDTPDAVRDGPIVGSALALLGDRGDVRDVAPLPAELAGWKIEGLAAAETDASGTTLLAVADQDDPSAASRAVWLRLHGERRVDAAPRPLESGHGERSALAPGERVARVRQHGPPPRRGRRPDRRRIHQRLRGAPHAGSGPGDAAALRHLRRRSGRGAR